MQSFLRILFAMILLIGLRFMGACGGEGSTINSNFPAIPGEPIPVDNPGDPADTNQVVTIAPGAGDQNGAIGEIESVSANQVLCVIIDPADGDLADLEVCEKSQANESADSVNGICPEADQETRCASANGGSGPDFCQVTGDQEYVMVILNLTGQPVTVAYQVIDVTNLLSQSCFDIDITEDFLTADN
jgi:hypothetical protein